MERSPKAMNFCSNCGTPVALRVPVGDDRPRSICDACRVIHYENPKMIVGCIPEWEDKVLLCLRAIEPRYGKWTLPAGFLEKGETVAEGAMRETMEEAGARVGQLTPFVLFSLPFIDQIHLMFRAPLLDCNYLAGSESLDVRLFREEEIPWDELAFTVVREALTLYFKDRAANEAIFHMGDISPSGEFIELVKP
jgi:ADP-ribose pyrophosphatase YjhB (NUDIX family)